MSVNRSQALSPDLNGGRQSELQLWKRQKSISKRIQYIVYASHFGEKETSLCLIMDARKISLAVIFEKSQVSACRWRLAAAVVTFDTECPVCKCHGAILETCLSQNLLWCQQLFCLASFFCVWFQFVYGQWRTHYIVSQHSWPWFNIVHRHNNCWTVGAGKHSLHGGALMSHWTRDWLEKLLLVNRCHIHSKMEDIVITQSLVMSSANQ